MARKFFVLLIAVGLVLAGCGASDNPGSGAGDKGDKQEKVDGLTKDKPRPDKEPGEKRPPKEQRADVETGEAPNEPERVSKPEPAPKPRPEPAVSASAAASASAGDYDEKVTVSRAVDGDTVEVSPAVGGVTDVRLIGIDTPETKDPSEEVEPYGPEASAFATEELTGQSVGLEFGAERIDQYDRLLAYVYVGEEMFNEVLVDKGYAQTYPYEPNTEYEGRFAAAQEEAKVAGLGIWGLPLSKQCLLANHANGIGEGSPGCGGSTASASASPEPTSSASASASASPSTSSPAPGGGGVSSGGGDIDCDEVNGPIPTPPGDPDGLDGDGDGLACE